MSKFKTSLLRAFIVFCAISLSLAATAQLSPENLSINSIKPVRTADARVSSDSFEHQPTMAQFDDGDIPPYGANLFTGDYSAHRSDGLNDAYLVAPGDKISIQLWGTVSQAEVLTVDNQGNIFVTEVGPINVQDVPASNLNAIVTNRIKSIYTKNVNVYVNLLSVTPVSIYVTGPVMRPGQYAGLASDSILFFLQQAGGIDAERGSYRNINVVRDGEVIKSYDLYEFLREGKIEPLSFRDSDVVHVAEQGAVVEVGGAVRYPFKFELITNQSKGEDLIYFARPLASVTHIGIIGARMAGSVAAYMPIGEFAAFEMGDGDTVTFNDDLQPDVISVSLSGSFIGPSIYAVDKNTRLAELLDHVEVDPNQADVNSIYIQRKSVVEQQKSLLDDALNRLERSIFTAPASSSGEAQIRAQEAELVMQFVERAREIVPLGKVVVSDKGDVANIRLENEDQIFIPIKTDLVQISGEVLMPQAVVFNSKAKVQDYIAWAGGYSERANTERIAVIHANGLLTFIDPSEGFSSDYKLKAGDQVLVLPKVDSKTMQAFKDITQIIFQIAVAANAAF